MKIYKQTLQLTDKQTVTLPADAKILSVQLQHGEIRLWYSFDEHANHQERHRFIYIVGTGHPFDIEEPYKFISTVQMDQFVWHIYEKEIGQ